MTEKLLTFPPPTPSPTSPDPGDGVFRSKFNFFSSTASIQHNTTKDICTGTSSADPGIFCQGGGGGSRLLNVFYSLKRGPNGFITHFPGVGRTFPRGGGPIETYKTITCDIPGGSGPPITTLDPHMDIVAFWHE